MVPSVEWLFVYTSPLPVYSIWVYTGLALCIAGKSIFLYRAVAVAIYSCWLCTGLALCIDSFKYEMYKNCKIHQFNIKIHQLQITPNYRHGYFVECRKLSRGNLWKIKCGTFRKLPLTAFPHSAAEKFRIFADRKTTICSHRTTDVQPMHSSVPRSLHSIFFVIRLRFAKEQGSVLQFWLT